MVKAEKKDLAERFINRELSWLAFNMRVLDEASNVHHPLLERLKFLSISSSNLDEFIMVRIAGLKDQVRNKISKLSDDGLTAAQQLQLILPTMKQLQEKQQQCWLNLEKELSHHDIKVVHKESLNANDISALKEYFETNIFPALSPLAVDAAHPFPFLPNLGLAVVLHLKESQQHLKKLAVILLPETLPRFIRIHKGQDRFIYLEDLVDLFSEILFPKNEILGCGLMRLIRDGELEIEDEAEDLMHHLESAVKRRRRGRVIYLETDDKMPQIIKAQMAAVFDIAPEDIIVQPQMLGLRSLMELYHLPYPALQFEPYTERFPERINDYGGDCFAAIAAKDILVHHPYETFDVVIKFLQQAAQDPNVVAIKQTLYRTSSNSPIVKALIEAAEAGKAVTVVVELKARFDEESNIRWARDLERVGAQVVFGFVNLKTHAKVSLVVRREGENLVSYAHLGTGNYHSITARSYADLSFFTCRKEICNDVALLFNYLTGCSVTEEFKALIVSPGKLRHKVIALIRDEIKHAKEGKPAAIWGKMNALVDPDIIDVLYEASQAGVKIDLIVRGVCVLRPGVKGLSENISVKSIIGRFLEHARIFCFGAGHPLPSEHAKLYISSADWMPRNFNSRVEGMTPIENATVHEQIMAQILLANFKDEKQSWYLLPDGSYKRATTAENAFSAHEYFMTNPSLSGRGKAISEKEVKWQREKIYRIPSTLPKSPIS